MSHPSPLHASHDRVEALFTPFGEVEIVADFGSLEREYAAIRKTAGLLDCPQRGLIQLKGGDRLEFLQRLISHDCGSLKPGEGRRALLLNGKGRIVTDMIVLEREAETWLDVDVHTVEPVMEALDHYLFADDVQLSDETSAMHRVSLHGPEAARLAGEVADAGDGEPAAYQHVTLTGEARSAAYRHDETGEVGMHLWSSVGLVAEVYGRLAAQEEREGLRTVGWLAFNTARIEAGMPIFNVDFGTDSLPHETGMVKELVSFTKGCYVGQEIVARMESLGHPAKLLVAFGADDDTEVVAGAPVFAESDANQAIGAVTSSTFSPLRGHTTVGLAIVKWGHHEPDTTLAAGAQSGNVRITTQGLGAPIR
ncbi:MAG: hypothetical protein CMJ49_09840 [Planctomycetaceae bacterium]|nr:hypothetical protein [Planctomycetaceae bacterium]